MASASQLKPPGVVEIERLGYRYTEEPQFDLSQLSTERRVQVRHSHSADRYAPAAEINRYAIQMGRSKFPPIIVSRDGWIVDGNTRVGGALKRGDKFFPAYVVEVDWESATQHQREELYAIGATMNSQNGVVLTPAERREAVRHLLGLDWTLEQIERVTGVKASQSRGVKQTLSAEKRLAEVGLELNGHLTDVQRKALGKQTAIELHDEPFRELARLAADAGMGVAEVAEFAREAKQAASDTEAIRLLEKIRAEMGDRIRQRELTGTGKPPAARQLRQALGGIVKYDAQEKMTLVERNPEVVGQHVEMIQKSIAVLEAVLVAQAAFDAHLTVDQA